MNTENSTDAKMLYIAWIEDTDGLIEQIPNVIGVQEGVHWVNMVCSSGETHMMANSKYVKIRLDPCGVEGITQ